MPPVLLKAARAMKRATDRQLELALPGLAPSLDAPPHRATAYPEFRYMGSKHRLLPWIHGVLSRLDFSSAADPFVGSGCVAYLMKSMGKRVHASDFLNFPVTLAAATIANDRETIDDAALRRLCAPTPHGHDFIARTFDGVFFAPEDLRFLDRVCANIEDMQSDHQRALAMAALLRSCVKKQPRGVFTISGPRYDDGRRDLKLSIEQHFREQIAMFNQAVFDNGQCHRVSRTDVFDFDPSGIDLVYLDPPYVPRSDDNCYIKRYHFLEGLSCYWKDLEILMDTKVRKIPKRFTPFSYRRTALDAFDRLFARFRRSTIVLSYSSNAFPDRAELESLLRAYKPDVVVHEKPHRYHFGTHRAVERAQVNEFLIVGR